MKDFLIVLLICYIIITVSIGGGLLMQHWIEGPDEDLPLPKIASITFFWPLYILFKIPKAIWWFLKFVYSGIVQFIKDAF